MEETAPISPLRRWLESILVWYILFILLYLFARFVLQTDWRFVTLVDNIVPYLFFPVIIGLLIAFLLRARRLSGLYFLVSLIGLLWVGRVLLPAQLTGTSGEGTVIQVITFNLFSANGQLSDVVDWLLEHDPDIIALQEIPQDMSDFSELTDSYAHSASLDSVMDSVVYSRYPILETETIDLTDWEVQRLVLDIEGHQVAFYNLHLFMPLNENGMDWIVLRYDDTRRNQQIRTLLEIVAEETLPVILAGDFNMSEWSPIYAEIDSLLQDAYRQVSWGIGATFPAGDSEEFRSAFPRLFRLDYVWYSEPIEARYAIVGSNSGSDHLPLRVELIIP